VLPPAIKDKGVRRPFEPFEKRQRCGTASTGALRAGAPAAATSLRRSRAASRSWPTSTSPSAGSPQGRPDQLAIGGNSVDIRVSTFTDAFSRERVLRILDRTVVQLDLNKIRACPRIFCDLARRSCASPTESSSCGAYLVGQDDNALRHAQRADSTEDKIITTEEPVEYEIEGLIQVPINAEIGVSFAACLRHPAADPTDLGRRDPRRSRPARLPSRRR